MLPVSLSTVSSLDLNLSCDTNSPWLTQVNSSPLVYLFSTPQNLALLSTVRPSISQSTPLRANELDTPPAGQSTQLSIDTSADGLLPPPDPSLATTFLSLNIFLVSAQNGINVSVSNGGLLDQEKGSTVKHLNYEVPACLPPGAYNVSSVRRWLEVCRRKLMSHCSIANFLRALPHQLEPLLHNRHHPSHSRPKLFPLNFLLPVMHRLNDPPSTTSKGFSTACSTPAWGWEIGVCVEHGGC